MGSKLKKSDLKVIIELHKQSLELVPEGHSLKGKLSRMLKHLIERYDTYEQFMQNPYTNTASQMKYMSDEQLQLGEYESKKSTNISDSQWQSKSE